MPNVAALTAVGLDDSDWDRVASGQHLAASVTHQSGAQVRGGVVPATDDPLKVIAGSGLSVTVKDGQYVLPVSTAGRGPTTVMLPADVSLTSETAHGTYSRLDRVIIEVADDGETTETTLAASASIGATSLSLTAPGVDEPALSTGFYLVGSEVVYVSALSGSGPYTATLSAALTAAHTSGDPISEVTVRVRIVKGEAIAGTPAAPSTNWVTPGGAGLSLGNGAWASLATISIPFTATSVSTITDERVWTAAAGGTVRVASVAALTAANLPEGTPVYILDSDTFGYTTSDAGAYQTVTKPTVVGARKWTKTQTIPSPQPYGLGDLRSSEVTAVAYGTAPATVIGTTPWEDLIITSTGLYDLEFTARAVSGTHAASYISMALTDETPAVAFDLQGRAQWVQVGVPLTAGAQLHPVITHAEASGSREYVASIKVKRVQ